MADASRWKLTEEIARGGVGVVWAAYDTQRERKVAVKFVSAKALPGTKARKRFLREAQVLTRLEHPNIVKVQEVGGDDAPYIVMDFVPCGSLEDRLQRDGVLPLREAAHIACQLALALHYAHQSQVLHRDLKPGNVLLRTDGEPLITDFGLAKSLDTNLESTAITERGTSVGTPGFWSPEQATGATDKYGPPTDVYGIGGTLYAMLTGKAPHQGKTLLQVFEAMKSGPRPPSNLREDLDSELERICLKCLAEAPGNRYQTAQALARDLERYLEADQQRPEADTIRSSCPLCGRTLLVDASQNGKRGRCPGCKRVLRIRPGTAVVSLDLSSTSHAENPQAAASAGTSWRLSVGGGSLVAAVAAASAGLAGGSALAVGVSALIMGSLAALVLFVTRARTSSLGSQAAAPDELVETIRTKAVTSNPERPRQRLDQAMRIRKGRRDPNA
jgi:serine/threonine protein kinase